MSPKAPLTWTARIVRCDAHDGDTLTGVHIDVGWGVTLSRSGTTPLSVRLTSSAGPINAPETYGPETQAGRLVRDWLWNCLTIDKTVRDDVWLASKSLDRDAYGRCIGEIYVGGDEVGLRMLGQGLAKKCGPGGVRMPFTRDELDAILTRLS